MISGAQQTAATAATRPPQPATTTPGVRRSVMRPDRRLEHPAAVEGQTGHQVEHADQRGWRRPAPPRRSAAGRRRAGRPATVAPRHRPRARSAARPRRSRTPAPGVCGLALDRGHAAQEVQGDRRDRRTRSAGPPARASLVQQHRERRAPPRTPTPTTYFQRAESGLRPPRPAAPSRTRSVRRPGTTSERPVRRCPRSCRSGTSRGASVASGARRDGAARRDSLPRLRHAIAGARPSASCRRRRLAWGS